MEFRYLLNKLVLVGLAGLLPLSAAHAQWSTNGTSVYYNGGNIGIGTSTPAVKLHVMGMGIFDGVHISSGANAIFGNSALGYAALQSVTSGGSNTAVGYYAMSRVTSGTNNTGVGLQVGDLMTTGSHNTLLGASAGLSITSSGNNTAIGSNALRSQSTFGGNTAIGTSALYASTTGNNNTGVGYNTAAAVTSGAQNTVLGYNSGQNLTTGNSNTIVGANVSVSSGSLSNNIIIADGQGNQRINVNSSGQVGLGALNTSYQLTVNGPAIGTAWDISSDARLKRDVSEIDGALAKIGQLRGITFEWIRSKAPLAVSAKRDIGVIAQDVEKVFPEVVSVGGNGLKSVSYSKLVAPLINAVKELHGENLQLKGQVEALERQIAEIRRELDAQK